MSLSNILMDINKTYNLDSLTQLTEDTFNILYPYTVKDYKSYKQLEGILTSKGLSCGNLYFNTEMHTNCWYIDGDVILYMPYLTSMSVESLSQKTIDSIRETYNKLKMDNDWESYISMQPSEFKVDIFKRCLSEIPKDRLLETMKSLYSSTSQIMTAMSKEDIISILSELDYSYEPNYSDKIDKDGLMTIYRGSTSKSTPIEDALSYSRDMNIAKHFAICVEDIEPKLSIAKVSPSNILLDIDEGEYEVLVDYRSLVDVETLDLYTMYDYRGMAEDLFNTVEPLLDLALGKDGIHGYTHSKRMLKYLCVMYANGLEDELNEDEFIMLAIACCIHDLGRTDDGRCTKHGENSLKYIHKALKLATTLNLINSDCNKTVCNDFLPTVVKYHCMPDDYAEKEIIDKHRGRSSKLDRKLYLLRLFKDLDNLDRVRTRDFDINYLRNKESIRCVGIAKTMFNKGL